MDMKSSTHLKILEQAFEERRKRNPRFSLRAFAKFLGIHPSALSRIMSCKQPVSIQVALIILRKLKLSESDQERFMVSVAVEKSHHAYVALSEGTEVVSLKSALLDSVEHVQAMADLVPDLLWRNEKNGLASWFNKHWMKHTGQTFDEAAGWGWIAAMHPDDRAKFEELYRKAIKDCSNFQTEIRIRDQAGNYRLFLVRARPWCNEQGELIHMYGVATDIHDLNAR